MTSDSVSLHILYGIPCVGKSTAAVRMAYHRNIRTVVHTDYVREVLRTFVSPDESPALAKVTHDAWELHGPPTYANIVTGFIEHVDAVATGIRAVVRKLVNDGFDAVVEGAHFHGAVIEDLRMRYEFADIRATLLVVTPAQELRRRIEDKERQRAACAERKRWHDNLPTLLALQHFLITDAHAHGINITTADERKEL